MTAQDPKVIELSFRVLENIIMTSKFQTKEELLVKANEMRDVAKAGEYPEELKLAYDEAINKLDSLSLEQIKELHDIMSD